MRQSYLKWSGGKRNALPFLLPVINEVSNLCRSSRLVEPFVGSATVALNADFNDYLLADDNADLINCHQYIAREDIGAIEAMLSPLFIAGFEKYYALRDKFNTGNLAPTEKAALFIYLNKFGFNGLCRYNASGGFNVSKGSSVSAKQIPLVQIAAFAEHFNGTAFQHQSFTETFKVVGEGDLVYCDPPYLPATKSDFKYTAAGFNIDHHEALRDYAKNADCPVIISNHDNALSRSLYADADKLISFNVSRSISCKTSTRGAAKELIAVYLNR